jgi:hypothetical protein
MIASSAPPLTTSTAIAAPHPARPSPPAFPAHVILLQETGRLHSAKSPQGTIYEQGQATGTYDCTITVQLTIISVNHVTATFTVKPKGGTISGKGSAQFKAEGANGYFGGTITITHGTGNYTHVSGTGIEISGIINRETFALTVHVHGTIQIT